MRDQLLRYGISIAFVVFIAACIGTFYIVSSESRFPDFKLVTEQGDDAELANVSFHGSFEKTGMHHYRLDNMMTINENGSYYSADKSFFERLDRVYDEEMKQLTKEYRKFMRGKYNMNSFYHDDEYLVYANVEGGFYTSEGFYFDVAILDKKLSQTSAFEIKLPDTQLYRYINVVEVQLFGDEIVVVTRNYLDNNTHGETGYHRYAFDINDNHLTHERIEFPFAVESDDYSYANVTFIGQSRVTLPSRYVAFYYLDMNEIAIDQPTATVDGDTSDNEIVNVQAATTYDGITYEYEVVDASIFVYDMQTGQMEEIQLDEVLDLMTDSYSPERLQLEREGEQVYLTLRESEAVRIIHYNIEDSSFQTYEINTAAADLTQISGESLYVLADANRRSTEPPEFKIFDLNSSELVYEGKMGIANNKFEEEAFEYLNIHQIVLNNIN